MKTHESKRFGVIMERKIPQRGIVEWETTHSDDSSRVLVVLPQGTCWVTRLSFDWLDNRFNTTWLIANIWGSEMIAKLPDTLYSKRYCVTLANKFMAECVEIMEVEIW